MKNKLFVTALIVACVSLIAFGTAANVVRMGKASNVITAGNIKIELIEQTLSQDETVDYPTEPIDFIPGTEIDKIVSVRNTGNNPAYIRVAVEKSAVPTEEEGEIDPELTDKITCDFDTASWTKGEDGYYYYKTALAAGETTEPLFTKVTFSEDLDNSSLNARVSVDVTVSAVQAKNNGITATDAIGWPSI